MRKTAMPRLKIPLPHVVVHHKHNKTSSNPYHYGHDDNNAFQVLLGKLAHNTLTEFKVGFDENEFKSKRDVQTLIKVVKNQFAQMVMLDKYSCLVSIRIGWRLPKYALLPIIHEVVPVLLQPPAVVTNLQLILNSWVPEPSLERIVSWYTLKCVDIRATRVRSRAVTTVSDPRHNRRTYSSSADDYVYIEDNIVGMVPSIISSAETLKLVDCDLLPAHMPELCSYLRRRRDMQHLSLRHNRHLSGHFSGLLNLQFLKTLDLSICDLDVTDGFAIAKALESSHSFEGLSVAGNFRIALAIPKIVEAASTRLVELDCSFCDVQNLIQKEVFSILANTTDCTLRSFRMQATRMNDCDALLECLEKNQSLERLIVDHPKDPFYVSTKNLRRILRVMEFNYHVQTLRLDTRSFDQPILDDMEFWLQLNRCGRGILLQDNKFTKDPSIAWPRILGRAARLKDREYLYWLVKRGVEHF